MTALAILHVVAIYANFQYRREVFVPQKGCVSGSMLFV